MAEHNPEWNEVSEDFFPEHVPGFGDNFSRKADFTDALKSPGGVSSVYSNNSGVTGPKSVRSVNSKSTVSSTEASRLTQTSMPVTESELERKARKAAKKAAKKEKKESKKEKKEKKAAKREAAERAALEEQHEQLYPSNAFPPFDPDAVMPGSPKGKNWDSFATQGTGKTSAMSMSTDASGARHLPFNAIHVSPGQGAVSRLPDEKEGMAQYHGDMLQAFLQKNGQDDTVAVATAMAFESFLKQQNDAVSQISGSVGSNKQDSKRSASQTDVDEEEIRMEQMERIIDEETFAPDRCWDNESFFQQAAQAPRRRNNHHHHDRPHRPPADDGYAQPRQPAPRNGMMQAAAAAHYEAARGRPAAPVEDNEAFRGQRSFEDQLRGLPGPYKNCVVTLKRNWEQGGYGGFPDLLYIRFAKCAPGGPYDFKSAWKVMKKFDRKYLNLNINRLEPMIRQKIVYPAPGLKSRLGHNMFFMKMNRFSPKDAPVDAVVNLVVYVMSSMLEDEESCSKGIGMIMDFSDWKMAHFSVPYFHKLMMVLQGRVLPTRVTVLLMVNTPSWFGNVWGPIIKPMLHANFKKDVVHRIAFNDLPKFLAVGFEADLPDDIYMGRAKADNLVWQFLAERKEVESYAF